MKNKKATLLLMTLLGPLIWHAYSMSGWAHEGLKEQIAELTKRIGTAPHNAILYLQRGELYRLHREWRAARADYDRAATLNASLIEVEFARGRMYLDSREPGLARRHLDLFIACRPDHSEALVIRARALTMLKQRLAAANDYSAAITVAGRPRPELYLERARTLAALGADHIDAALAGLDQGIQRLGPLVALELYAIDLELSRKRFSPALERLALVAKQALRKETWLYRRGTMLKMAGRKNEAIAAFRAAQDAIDSLPSQYRTTRLIKRLESQLRAELR